MKKSQENQTTVPVVNQSSVPAIPETRSFERVVFINEDTGESSIEPKEGYVPYVIPKYNYQIGQPETWVVNLKDAVFGALGTPTEEMKPVNEFSFVPLHIAELNQLVMYPQKDERTGDLNLKPVNFVSVVAYVPGYNNIVSFLLRTWSASELVREYKKGNRTDKNGVPVFLKTQLLFKCRKYKVESVTNKPWALKFEVDITPLKPAKELAEFVSQNVLFSIDHYIEAISRNKIQRSQVNRYLWLSELAEKIGADGIDKLFAMAAERAAIQGNSIDSDESADFEVVPSAIEPPRAEVPAERVANFYRNYEECMPYMSIEERQELSIKYSISHNDFVSKGKKLLSIMEEIKSGARKVESEPSNDLPF